MFFSTNLSNFSTIYRKKTRSVVFHGTGSYRSDGPSVRLPVCVGEDRRSVFSDGVRPEKSDVRRKGFKPGRCENRDRFGNKRSEFSHGDWAGFSLPRSQGRSERGAEVSVRRSGRGLSCTFRSCGEREFGRLFGRGRTASAMTAYMVPTGDGRAFARCFPVRSVRPFR